MISKERTDAPPQATEEEIAAEREAELSALQEELDKMTSELDERGAALAKARTAIDMHTAKLAQLQVENNEQEEVYKTRKKILDLLPDADNNIIKLQQIIDTATKKLMAMGRKWEAKRVELIAQYRDLRATQMGMKVCSHFF